MTTTETDLAAWLLRQVEVDEAIIREQGETHTLVCEATLRASGDHVCGCGMADRVLIDGDTTRRLVAMFPVSAPKMEYGGFVGFQARDCGEHRTVGPHRAWCHDCSEWCYPKSPCARCHGVSDVLRVLALSYADRPGYQEEWKP